MTMNARNAGGIDQPADTKGAYHKLCGKTPFKMMVISASKITHAKGYAR